MRAAVTPRFAICCTTEALMFAGEQGRDSFVQTHLAETTAEIEAVRALFPDQPHYTAVYESFGLLHERTLLAHCLHLSDAEWDLIAQQRSVVVHCPQANAFLQSGLFDLDAARVHGVRLALGSDIGAGCDVAMPRVARAMLEMAKLRKLTVAPEANVPTPAEAWDLITRRGAEALGCADGGRLDVGAAADLLLLRPPFDVDEHLLGRLIYTWEDGYIAARVVAGKVIPHI
jgi:guanine deaminase